MKQMSQAATNEGRSIGNVILKSTPRADAPDIVAASSSAGFIARKAGSNQRNANGSSCQMATQTIPQNENISNGGLLRPNSSCSTKLISPFLGPSNMIQPDT